jgi:hypothetical protein
VLQAARNKGKKMELLFGQFRNRPLVRLVCQSFVKTEIAVYAFGSPAKNDLSIIGSFWQSGPYLLLQKCRKTTGSQA